MGVNHSPAFPNTALLHRPIEQKENYEKMKIDEDDISLQYFNNFPSPRMYDVDGNGVIDQEEMTKIVQVKIQNIARNIAACLEDTANWDSNFLQLKTPINLLAHISNNL